MRFSKRLRAALAGNALPEEETPLFTGGALKKLILPLIIEQTLTITVGHGRYGNGFLTGRRCDERRFAGGQH